MKIALIGYGKMGHTIEQIALQRGHSIVLRVTTANKNELANLMQYNADVAIEFTTPASAKDNVLQCLEAGIPVVCGTTGWNEQVTEAHNAALAHGTAFLQSSNFSIGVNIFFEVNKLLAKLMNSQPEYNVTIEETHHTQKKDAPSGTAITIAEQIIDNMNRKESWVKRDEAGANELPIISHRIEDVPGTHKVTYSSSIDDIELVHTAHNRNGFALGAVLAAEFVAGKKGVYSMKDVLGIN